MQVPPLLLVSKRIEEFYFNTRVERLQYLLERFLYGGMSFLIARPNRNSLYRT